MGPLVLYFLLGLLLLLVLLGQFSLLLWGL
jgi:hypothetical protein